ncbi:hypothetical protein M501DRAFT_933353 [Patellaria atrata CBS 101060]|uniref:Nuclear pore complex protein Nup85 n=1 Tax=Patellaria atrata CBS 101060 TaxID=1346257 RepID=A0A9P4SBB1_9PEZI|nr:hypothetical protein M501DRAFT_933353 [Patellaria atrata CBS 101060]
MSFRVPSSTPPSTPDARRSARSQHPSTTPAGPPPTFLTNNSFTPAGLPPSSAFGSSQLPTFSSTNKQPIFNPVNRPSGALQRRPLSFDPFERGQNGGEEVSRGRTGYRAPGSSPPRFEADGDAEEEDDVEYEDEGEEGDSGDAMEEDEYEEDYTQQSRRSIQSRGGNESIYSTPRSLKRSRLGSSLRRSTALEGKSAQELDMVRQDITAVAKGLVASAPRAQLRESDDLILETDRVVSELAELERPDEESLKKVAQKIHHLWDRNFEINSRIGPDNQADGITKANFVGSLLLQLHHPSTPKIQTRPRPSTLDLYRQSQGVKTESCIPKVLLDWLNTYHNPGRSDIEDILKQEEGFSAHEMFWDSIYSSVLRGNFQNALKLLKGADLSVAAIAFEDGMEDGYHGRQLESANKCIDRAIELIQRCPAVRSNDWDVKNTEWSLYRREVEDALRSLRKASGENFQEDETQAFEASNFGISNRSNGFGLSAADRRAESQVPLAVVENLTDLYKILRGDPDDILNSCMDWLEAVITLTVWWDGEDEVIPPGAGSLAQSRMSLLRSKQIRLADVTPLVAYRQRLASSLALVMDGYEVLQPLNKASPVEVGLACAVFDSVEGALSIIQRWSMPYSIALVEMASAGDWLNDGITTSKSVMRGFDQSDLMVLSYGQQESSGIKRDDLLSEYADLIASKDTLQSSKSMIKKEGWELAIQILSRLDNPDLATSRIDALLDRLSLTSEDRVDKILHICHTLDLSHQAETIAEKYATTLSSTTKSYGSALYYFALAHRPHKIKETTDLLITLCLTHSTSFPPLSSLDTRLKSLIKHTPSSLTALADTDPTAAESLAKYLSGYATIREFYDLRDDTHTTSTSAPQPLTPTQQKKKASHTLLTAILSAASSIRGGLYDPADLSVVPVDALPTLLGEALPFIDRTPRVLSLQQLMALLRVAEDLQTVSAAVAEGGRGLLGACMKAYNSSTSAAVGGMGASAYSIGGSEGSGVLVSVSNSGEGTGEKEMAQVRRGWDWRQGVARGDVDEVIRLLRLGVAREVGRAWVEGEES